MDAALRDAQQGDVAAFNTLVLAHQRHLYNVCYRTLGNAEDAADASQDAFLNAFRNLKSFNGPANGLKAWLLRIAVNACYDHLRRRQRRPTESLEGLSVTTSEQAHTSAADRVVDPTPGPEQRSLGSETAAAIQAAIDRLPYEQRMTVILCDVQGLSYEETAQAMSVELGTVKSRLSRARAQLRDMLTQKGELPASSQRLPQ